MAAGFAGDRASAGARADIMRVAATRNVEKRSPGVVCTLLAGLVVFFAFSSSTQLLREARAEEELRVITGGPLRPFMYLDATGARAGFDIDIANALCAALVMRCSFIDVAFEEALPALIAGKGDAVIASMTITEERKKLVAFTNHYYRTAMRFVARKGFDRPITPDGLRGLRIGGSTDSTGEAYARQVFGGTAEIVSIPRYQEDLYRALIEGKIDLAISDSLEMWAFTTSAEGRDFIFVGAPIYLNGDIGIAVRKEDNALRERLNAAIARIRLDGTYAKINAKYFPFSIY
jgi:ABC-type amino acid transport substrate-binding protein